MKTSTGDEITDVVCKYDAEKGWLAKGRFMGGTRKMLKMQPFKGMYPDGSIHLDAGFRLVRQGVYRVFPISSLGSVRVV